MQFTMKKQAFIVYLRALAAIIVLLSHLLCMFWNGGVAFIWSFLATDVAPVGLRAINPANYLAQVHLNAGSIGVAFFFLITGYLSAWSKDKYTHAGGFLAVKALRIYPVYLIEFSVTFGIIYLYTHFNNIPFPYSFTDWLGQVSLLRVFFWLPSIDEISWTLVADMEFYLLVALLIAFKRTSVSDFTIAGLILTLISALCRINMSRLLDSGQIAIYQAASHITLGAFCVTFMLLGTIIGDYERGNLDKKQLFGAASIVYLSFIINCASYAPELSLQYICSYTLSAIVFVICLSLEKGGHCISMFENRFLGWISRISYSLFIIHGLNGYILETVMFKSGINNYLVFTTSVLAVTVLSAILYYCCEKPFNVLHKRVSRWVAEA